MAIICLFVVVITFRSLCGGRSCLRKRFLCVGAMYHCTYTSRFVKSSSNSSRSSSSKRSSSMGPVTPPTAPSETPAALSLSAVESSTPSSMMPYSSNLISWTLTPAMSSSSSRSILDRSNASPPSSSSSSCATILGSNMNISLPDMPVRTPDENSFFFLLDSFFSFSIFSASFRFFHLTKDSMLTGVRSVRAPSSARRCSISSSREISSFFSSSFFLSFLRTKPGGSAWRYLQLVPPSGHVQNHPYLLFSTASRKNLQIMSVWLLFSEPCFFLTTSASLSSSQSSMLSSLSRSSS